MLYDSHAHLDDEQLYQQLPEVLEQARDAGVKYINTIGCDWRSSLMAVRLAEKFQGEVFAAIGVHPHEATSLDEQMIERLHELALSKYTVAWGEIGLDYHYDYSPRPIQQQAFRQQIYAAKLAGLPLIIHDREAHEDTLKIIREEKGGINGGVWHCFSGSWEMAKECMRLGFHISFAGPLTFNNACKLTEVASNVPLDMVLVETDSPYLSPQPLRGKTNQPSNVYFVAKKLSEIRKITIEEIAAITTNNALNLFNIKSNNNFQSSS